MSWRDRLLTASFKDVTFKIKSSDYGVGRRAQIHQFVNRKLPYYQDLGQEGDQFVVEGYIVQSSENEYDYFDERDALIEALKSEGAGILIHPFYGIKNVGLEEPARITETFDEGGIARFSMTFRETGERVLPESLPDIVTSVDKKSKELNDVAGDFFVLKFNASPLYQKSPLTIMANNLTLIQKTLTSLSGIVTRVITQSLNNLNVIRDQLLTIYSDPISVFNSIKNSCYGLAVTVGMGALLFQEQTEKAGTAGVGFLSTMEKAGDIFAYLFETNIGVTGGETGSYSGITRGTIVTLNQDTVPEVLGKSVVNNLIAALNEFNYSALYTTPKNQQNNLCVIFDTFKFCLINILCRIAIRINFYSKDDLIEYLNKITDAIENILFDYGAEAAQGSSALGIGTSTDPIDNKDLFLALQTIRNTFIEGMLLKASSKSKYYDYNTKSESRTTLEMAYDLYEDINRSSEIYQRNKDKIYAPGFVPGGIDLRILDE